MYKFRLKQILLQFHISSFYEIKMFKNENLELTKIISKLTVRNLNYDGIINVASILLLYMTSK